jgi:hypothetical protein
LGLRGCMCMCRHMLLFTLNSRPHAGHGHLNTGGTQTSSALGARVQSGRGEAHVGRLCASRGASAGSRGGRSARGRRSRRGAACCKTCVCTHTARRRPQAATEKRVSPSAHAVIFTAVVDLIPHLSGTGARTSSKESAVKRPVSTPLARGSCGICWHRQDTRWTTTKTRRCGYQGCAHPTRHGAEAARV